MEERVDINLKQYIPQKAKKKYIVQVVIYIVILIIFGLLISKRISKDTNSTGEQKEIRGVTIDMESKQ